MKKKPNRIRIVIVEPGKAPRVEEIPNTLSAMQSVVEGHIELTRFASHVMIVCNECGRVWGMDPNIFGCVGTIFFARDDGEELASLTDEQIETLLRLLPQRSERL